MLNKEEIEISDMEIPIPLNTKLLEREYRDLYIRHKILLGEKQELIEKLEKDIENNNFKETECLEDKGRYYYAKEILEILKGENHEHI